MEKRVQHVFYRSRSSETLNALFRSAPEDSFFWLMRGLKQKTPKIFWLSLVTLHACLGYHQSVCS